jgi:hypothetical protein
MTFRDHINDKHKSLQWIIIIRIRPFKLTHSNEPEFFAMTPLVQFSWHHRSHHYAVVTNVYAGNTQQHHHNTHHHPVSHPPPGTWRVPSIADTQPRNTIEVHLHSAYHSTIICFVPFHNHLLQQLPVLTQPHALLHHQFSVCCKEMCTCVCTCVKCVHVCVCLFISLFLVCAGVCFNIIKHARMYLHVHMHARIRTFLVCAGVCFNIIKHVHMYLYVHSHARIRTLIRTLARTHTENVEKKRTHFELEACSCRKKLTHFELEACLCIKQKTLKKTHAF